MSFFRSLQLVVVGLILCSSTVQAYEITPVLVSGDPVPAPATGMVGFAAAPVARGGNLMLTGSTVGAFVWVNGAIAYQQGDFDPSGSGFQLGFPATLEPSTSRITSTGEALVATTLLGGNFDRVAYIWDGSGLTLVARTGNPIPGASGQAYGDMSFFGLTDSGTFCCKTVLQPLGDTALLRGGTILQQVGTTIVGGGSFDSQIWTNDFDLVEWNGAGDVVFLGQGNGAASTDEAIFRVLNSTNSLELLVGEGDSVTPLTGPNPDSVNSFECTSIASTGDWAVFVKLASQPAASSDAIVTAAGLVFQAGLPAGSGTGGTIGAIDSCSINAVGDLVVIASIENATDPDITQGLFLNGTLILRNSLFLVANQFVALSNAIIDDTGTIYFEAFNGVTGGQGVYSLTPEFIRGDTNGDGSNNVADAVYLLGNLFPGVNQNELHCLDAADANNDCSINIADAVIILNSLFGSPAVPLPVPNPTTGCGPDTGCSLGCAVPTPSC
ncbi:MAG: dockerin type I repeat-containing protein [Planctomycetota bacterium]